MPGVLDLSGEEEQVSSFVAKVTLMAGVSGVSGFVLGLLQASGKISKSIPAVPLAIALPFALEAAFGIFGKLSRMIGDPEPEPETNEVDEGYLQSGPDEPRVGRKYAKAKHRASAALAKRGDDVERLWDTLPFEYQGGDFVTMVMRHTAKVEMLINGSPVADNFAFGVRGHWWMLPAHMFTYPWDELRITRGDKGGVLMSRGLCSKHLRVHPRLDVAFLYVENAPPVSDIVPLFPPVLETSSVVRYRRDVIEGSVRVLESCSDRMSIYTGENTNVRIPHMSNRKGDCGLVYIDPRNGTIRAFHTRGSPQHAVALGVGLTRSEVEKFITEDVTVTAYAPMPEYQSCRTLGIVQTYGTLAKRDATHMPSTTALRPTQLSPYIEKDFPITKAPAHLKQFRGPDGETISPLNIALESYDDVPATHAMPFATAQEAWRRITPNDFNPGAVEPLTLEEAVLGKDLLKPMDMAASPGYWGRKLNLTRRDMFQVDHDQRTVVVEPRTLKRIDHMWDALRKGPIQLIFTDTLKDELRPIDRVAQGKTRIFFADTVESQVIARRLFGPILPRLESSPTATSCAIGINPTSIDWGDLLAYLTRDDYKLVTFDLKRYDISYPYWAIVWYAYFMSRYSRDRTRARNYLLSLGQQIHVLMNLIYHAWFNPSGNWHTSHLGVYFHVMVWTHIFNAQDIRWRGTFYSDDCVIGIHPQDAPRIEWKSLVFSAKVFAGLTVTDANKGQDFGFQSWTEVEFLSRKFARHVWCGRHVLTAPLKTSSLESMFHYTLTKDKHDEPDDIESKLRTLELEAAQHGPEYYSRVARIAQTAATLYRRPFVWRSYQDVVSELLQAHY